MSSKRGRKLNVNLPPNRARDVQRAFRARRAAHIQALERRVDELEKENECYRETLNLPPSESRPLGRGPTGRDKRDDDHADKSQCQTVSPTRESTGSPSSYASSPEPGHSLIALSISSRAMSMDVGPPHLTMVVNECHTALSNSRSEQGHPIGESILAPCSPDRVLPPLYPPSIPICSQKTPTSYSPTSEGFIESDFDARQPRRREVQHTFHGLSPNFPNSDQYLHSHSYHGPNQLHRQWNSLPSDHVHTVAFRDQGFPESHRFPQPPEQAHPSHTVHNLNNAYD